MPTPLARPVVSDRRHLHPCCVFAVPTTLKNLLVGVLTGRVNYSGVTQPHSAATGTNMSTFRRIGAKKWRTAPAHPENRILVEDKPCADLRSTSMSKYSAEIHVRYGIGKQVGLHMAHISTARLEAMGQLAFACRVCGFRSSSALRRRTHERVYHRILAAASRALDRALVRRMPLEAMACRMHWSRPAACTNACDARRARLRALPGSTTACAPNVS